MPYRQLLILSSDANSTSASLLLRYVSAMSIIRSTKGFIPRGFTHHRRCKREKNHLKYRIMSSLSLAFLPQWRLMGLVVPLRGPSFPV